MQLVKETQCTGGSRTGGVTHVTAATVAFPPDWQLAGLAMTEGSTVDKSTSFATSSKSGGSFNVKFLSHITLFRYSLCVQQKETLSWTESEAS